MNFDSFLSNEAGSSIFYLSGKKTQKYKSFALIYFSQTTVNGISLTFSCPKSNTTKPCIKLIVTLNLSLKINRMPFSKECRSFAL